MTPSDNKLVYSIEDTPPWPTTVVLGFQHYLTMFGSTVAIPFILAKPLGIEDNKLALAQLIGTIFFVSGITTMLQTQWGNRLPIVQGGTFSFLAATSAICGMASLKHAGFDVRIAHVQGAIIAGSFFQIIVGYTGLVGKLLRFIGPVTIAPTIALIGLALFKIGAPKAGLHWATGGLTIALVILCSQYLRKVHRIFQLFPILIAIVIAWLVSAIFTWTGTFGPTHPAHIDTTILSKSPWFRIPYPFQWGMPKFMPAAIVGMLSGYVASIVESIGDYFACARLSGAPVPTPKVINRGIGMEGVGCLIAGIFGTGNGTTSYSENIGAIGLTGVGSRRVVQAGACLMLFFGAVGKFGALFTTIPGPIVGGMYCVMFGMIASVGLSNLQYVDLNSGRNLFIIGFSLFMGLSMPEYFAAHPVKFQPTWASDVLNTLGSTGMAVGALFAVILDNTVPGTIEERGLAVWRGTAATSEPEASQSQDTNT
jgi:solute carrier family 23 (nucleobase transporter), member 1